MNPVHVAWLGLGSNLDGPDRRLAAAIDALGRAEAFSLLAVSRIYCTTPVGGPQGQPDFRNAAAAVATHLDPLALWSCLERIEQDQGRERNVRWGPRTLDIDILAFDTRCSHDPRLTLPHPRAHERAFVLVPLADIAPALVLGRAGRVIDCLARCETSGVVPVAARS